MYKILRFKRFGNHWQNSFSSSSYYMSIIYNTTSIITNLTLICVCMYIFARLVLCCNRDGSTGHLRFCRLYLEIQRLIYYTCIIYGLDNKRFFFLKNTYFSYTAWIQNILGEMFQYLRLTFEDYKIINLFSLKHHTSIIKHKLGSYIYLFFKKNVNFPRLKWNYQYILFSEYSMYKLFENKHG